MPKRLREESPPVSPSDSILGTPYAASPASTDSSHPAKYIQTSEETPPKAVMKCSLPPHQETLSFTTIEDFDVHYAKEHTHVCIECFANFPTEHFLGLHISERHDPLNLSRRAKGEKTYRCFVEDCERLFSNPTKRRLHLRDKHNFPKTYNFLVTELGINRQSSMLRPRQRQKPAAYRPSDRRHRSEGVEESSSLHEKYLTSQNTDTSPPDAELKEGLAMSQVPSPDADVDALTSKISALKFVPPSVRFGRGGRRGGLSRS